ncbi:TPA: hypothetical protein EYP12_06180 [Candidatus Bipolaricaulota bacterium]|nr:hypothetical protein [Candidatus Bipolaricaulota bacterium]
MKDIDDVKADFGWSKRQVLTRVKALDSLIDGHLRTGKRGAILFTEDALRILSRLKSLENDGLSIGDAVEQMRRELSGDQGKGNPEDVTLDVGVDLTAELLKALYDRIEGLEAQLAEKDRQLREKDKQIEKFQDLLINRLPPAPPKPEMATEAGAGQSQAWTRTRSQKVSRWTRLVQLIKGR